MKRTEFATAAGAALLAALLFGASTPLAKVLLRDVSPVLLAGLLYLGSGIGLGLARTVRDRGIRATREGCGCLLLGRLKIPCGIQPIAEARYSHGATLSTLSVLSELHLAPANTVH